MCWCAQGYTCSLGSHFRYDVGELRIIGVSDMAQHRTCVAGQTCLIDGIVGQDLSAADTITVLDTCSTLPRNQTGVNQSAVLPRFSEAGVALIVGSGSTNATTNGSTVTVANGAGRVNWGTAFITSPGGKYRLCWCAGGQRCDTMTESAVDFGSLTIIGPQLGQMRTCVAGQACLFDGIRGYHLSDADHVLVMETCGARSLQGFPNSGFVSSMSSSGTSYHWGSFPLSTAGGRYQLCWCSSGFSCSTTEDFRVTAGVLHVIGPASVPGYSTWRRVDSRFPIPVLSARTRAGERVPLLDSLTRDWPRQACQALLACLT